MLLRTISLFLLAALIVAVVPPQRAEAHPHAFIDGGVGFVMQDGMVTGMTVNWIHDPLYTLFVIGEAGLDPDGDGRLTRTEIETLVMMHMQWVEGFAGDSYLWADDRPVTLSGPLQARGSMTPDGQFQMDFIRTLETPVDPRRETVIARAYDPGFYTAYTITDVPRVQGDAACNAEVAPPPSDPTDSALVSELAQLDRDETAADLQVGARFAQTVTLRCE